MESTSATATAEISTGSLRGTRDGGIERYLGIPYAEPPFGERRFAAPEPVAAWTGVRDAVGFGATAPQHPYRGDIAELLSSTVIEGDDILTVNVWSPAERAAAGAPVARTGTAPPRGSHRHPVQ